MQIAVFTEKSWKNISKFSYEEFLFGSNKRSYKPNIVNQKSNI